MNYTLVAYRPEENNASNVTAGIGASDLDDYKSGMNKTNSDMIQLMNSTLPGAERIIPVQVLAIGYGPNVADKDGLLSPYDKEGWSTEALVKKTQLRLEKFGPEGVIRVDNRFGIHLDEGLKNQIESEYALILGKDTSQSVQTLKPGALNL